MYAVPDVMTGITEVVQEVTPHGSGIVINPPVYPPFFFRLRLAGREVVEAPLPRDPSGRYHLDPGALDEALARDSVAAYLLCSPHNPTGRVWSRDDLITVADICARRGVVLVVDEIHAPLALPGARHTPFLSLDLEHDLARRTFTFTSASKGWNIGTGDELKPMATKPKGKGKGKGKDTAGRLSDDTMAPSSSLASSIIQRARRRPAD